MYPSELTTAATALLLQIHSFEKVRVYANSETSVASPQIRDLYRLVTEGYVHQTGRPLSEGGVDHTFNDLRLTAKGKSLFNKIMSVRADEPTIPTEQERKCWDIEGRELIIFHKYSDGAYKARDDSKVVTILPADWGVSYFTKRREAAHASRLLAESRLKEQLRIIEQTTKTLLELDGFRVDDEGRLNHSKFDS